MTPGSASAESSATQPMSPELVLVDPELALWARQRLADHKRVEEAPASPLVRPEARTLEVAPSFAAPTSVPTSRRPRRRHVLATVSSGAACGALLLLVGDAVPRDEGRARPDRTDLSPEGAPRRPVPAERGGTRPPQPAPERATPTSPPTPRERPAAAPRRFVWVPVAKARYYEIQLFRNRAKILDIRSESAGFTLAPKWTYRGHRYALSRGRYRWVVRPGFGSPSGNRLGGAIVRSSLVVR
jgi:hypothetical protein